MEMNFPHDMPIQASSAPISLRKLDMDILRVLAFTPAMAVRRGRQAGVGRMDSDQALMALFAGSGRADQVARGSFNPHFAVAMDQFAVTEQQGETDVYHCTSVNRKEARLLRSHTPIVSNQAF